MKLQVTSLSWVVADTKYIRIKVSPSAKSIVERIADDEDMTEQGLASRVYEWFGDQPRLIQLAIIGRYPREIAPDLVRLILHRLGGPDAGEDVLPEDSRKRIQKALSEEREGSRRKGKAGG